MLAYTDSPPPFIAFAVEPAMAASQGDMLNKLLEGFGELRGTVAAMNKTLDRLQDGVSELGERQAGLEGRMERAENANASTARTITNAYRNHSKEEGEARDDRSLLRSKVQRLEEQIKDVQTAAEQVVPDVAESVTDRARPWRVAMSRKVGRVQAVSALGAVGVIVGFAAAHPGIAKGAWTMVEQVVGGGAKLIDSSFGG